MSDIIIEQGTDAAFTWPITNDDGTPFDPFGWSAKMDIRSHNGNILHTFSTDIGNLAFGTGVLVATWTAEESNLWQWSGGRYDLYLFNNDESIRVDMGYISLSKAVTVL